MRQSSITTHDGIDLFVRSYETENSKARIIACHGFMDHSGRYASEAEWFNQNGYDFIIYDHRAHGHSGGKPKAYIHDFNHFVKDLKTVNNHINNDDKPFFLFGHSMGGLVQLSYLLDHYTEDQNFKGVLFSAPFLMPDKNTAPLLQKMSGFVAAVLPKLKTIKLDVNEISTDPVQVKAYAEDPLNYTEGIYAKSGFELLKQLKKVAPRFQEFSFPFIIQHGTIDKLAEPQGSQLLFEQSKSEDKELIKLEGIKHEITRDVSKKEVLEKYTAWMDDRLSP